MKKDYADIGMAITNLGILALIAFALYLTGSVLVFFGLCALFIKKTVPVECVCKECGGEIDREQCSILDQNRNVTYQISPIFHFWD